MSTVQCESLFFASSSSYSILITTSRDPQVAPTQLNCTDLPPRLSHFSVRLWYRKRKNNLLAVAVHKNYTLLRTCTRTWTLQMRAIIANKLDFHSFPLLMDWLDRKLTWLHKMASLAVWYVCVCRTCEWSHGSRTIIIIIIISPPQYTILKPCILPALLLDIGFCCISLLSINISTPQKKSDDMNWETDTERAECTRNARWWCRWCTAAKAYATS